MDKVILDGKEYEKSSVVAKRFGYTADYMGQLSRGGKIDAELVGRSWYVYAPSVEDYQEGLYESEAESAENNSNSEESTVTNEFEKNSAKLSELGFASDSAETNSRVDSIQKEINPRNNTYSVETKHWQRISYSKDSAELVPHLSEKRMEDKDVTDGSQKAEKVRVHTAENGNFSIVSSKKEENRTEQKPSKVSVRRSTTGVQHHQTPSPTIPRQDKAADLGNTEKAVSTTASNSFFNWYFVIFIILSLVTVVFAIVTVFLARTVVFKINSDLYSSSITTQAWDEFYSALSE